MELASLHLANLVHLAEAQSVQPAEYLIAALWQGLLLAAIAWLILEALPRFGFFEAARISPKTRFSIWMAVFLLSALLPLLTISGWAMPAVQLQAQTFAAAGNLSTNWALALAVLWAATSAFCLARLSFTAFRLIRITTSCEPIESAALTTDLDDGIKSLLQARGSRKIRLCLSAHIDAPMAVGFFRPAILVPDWLWLKLSSQEKNQIILHELSHLERRDDWTNLLQKLFRAVFPFNPALVLAEQQLCRQREMACDDAVLGFSIAPREYAACLAGLAEKRLQRRAELLAPGAWQRRPELAGRVHRILRNKPASRPLHSRSLAAACSAGLFGVGLILAHCPQLVTFSDAVTTGPAIAARAQAQYLPASLRSNKGSKADSNADSNVQLVQANMRVSPPARKPVRKVQPHLRRAVIQRHLQSARAGNTKPGLIEAAFQPEDLNRQPVKRRNPPLAKPQTEIILTLIEIQPADIAAHNDGFPVRQFAIAPSQTGWIIFQL